MWVKNCSWKPMEEWNKNADHVAFGAIYVTMALIFEIMYIPFLIAMLKKEVFKHSCYKLMFMLGIFDMCALVADAILPGIQSIRGEHFCGNPIYYYTTGGIAMGLYNGVCAICCFLALDRFLTTLYPEAAKALFQSWRFIIWPTLTILYMIVYFVFQTSVIFNPNHQKFFFDPYRYTDLGEVNPRFYDHPLAYINSGVTVVVLGTLYGALCIVLYLKPKSVPTITKLQKVMLLQSLVVCAEMFFLAFFYIGDALGVPLPEFITKYEQFVLILMHGDTPIVYLLLNDTLRKQVYNDIKAHLLKVLEVVSAAKSFFEKKFYPMKWRNRVQPIDAFMTSKPNLTVANNGNLDGNQIWYSVTTSTNKTQVDPMLWPKLEKIFYGV